MNKKKKILILSHAMELGGAERSLLGLLEAFNPNKYEIDLFLMRHEGALLNYIPSYVNLLPEIPSYTVLARPMIKTLKEGHFLLTISRMYGKIAAKSFDRTHNQISSDVALEYSHKFTKRWMPKINEKVTYDLAVSFLTPHYFVSEKVSAKKKIAWIHTDYSKIQINVDSELQMWNAYDYVVSISDSVTESFLKVFPSLESKIRMIENMLPENLIRKQVCESNTAKSEMEYGKIKVLSIGRFCAAKNFDNVPDICRRIREKGIDIHWYLIGYGPDDALIRNKIENSKMENFIHILGKKDNPYPYIKECDFYVQPSRFEGHCVTVKEAQMLSKPVIITRYSTSASQLEENVDGIIVEQGNEETASGIFYFLKDQQKQLYITDNCCRRDYSNKQEIEKLYALIG